MSERVARAIYESHGFVGPWDHEHTQQLWGETCRAEAQAAIAAYRADLKERGLVVVPREPTPEMENDGLDKMDFNDSLHGGAESYNADVACRVYRAMIAAEEVDDS